MFGMSRKRQQGVTPRAVRLTEKAADVASISVRVEPVAFARKNETGVLIEISAAGVNPSDVKAAMGMMPYAVFPRTPGRDFAGVVIEGPKNLIGAEVFGSSGDLGIRRDGTHATHLVLEAEAAVLKPRSISLDEAAAIGVPFVTAVEGLTRGGMPKPGATVLILGVNGKVGQAAAQIASWKGARVIGVVRRPEPYHGHASGTVEVIDSSSADVAARVSELTGGKGADIVYNTVGEPYYEAGTKSLAKGGTQIFIASFKQTVPFDIFAFYRGRHTYAGVDTLAMSSSVSAVALRSLLPGFESGALKPFPIAGHAIYPLSKATAAYAAVLDSARDRIILKPGLES
jgi:NADPH:quinone reductase